MKRPLFLLLGLTLLLAACGDDDAPDSVVPAAGAGGGAAGEGPLPGNGQTGSMGSRECTRDAQCRDLQGARLAAYVKPSPRETVFASARCENVRVIGESGTVSGSSCQCASADGGARVIGPRGLDCYVFDRSGECLWSSEEFTGCELDDAQACRATCDELAARLDADAQREIEGRLVHAACNEVGSCESVVELDGRCFVNNSFQGGAAYDCALTPDEIIAQYRQDQQTVREDPLPPSQSSSPYVEGTHGFVELSAQQTFWGGAAGTPSFFGFAQFFDVEGMSRLFGEVIDPLEGVDDCGVVRRGDGGTAADIRFQAIAHLTLIDGAQERPFVPGPGNNGDFYAYILELDPAAVAPRFGERYGLRGGGGPFGEDFALDSLRLPDALAVPELERSARVPRDALALTWSGRGEAPLRIQLIVNEGIDDLFEPYAIDCLVEDDGAFEIPAAVLQAAPEGFVTANFIREQRVLMKAGDKRVAAIGRVQLSHHFALGEACDRADVMAACLRYAEHVTAAFEECSTVPARPLSELCPAYLAEACTGCAEVFECRTKNTVCTPEGLQVNSNSICTCE